MDFGAFGPGEPAWLRATQSVGVLIFRPPEHPGAQGAVCCCHEEAGDATAGGAGRTGGAGAGDLASALVEEAGRLRTDEIESETRKPAGVGGSSRYPPMDVRRAGVDCTETKSDTAAVFRLVATRSRGPWER